VDKNELKGYDKLVKLCKDNNISADCISITKMAKLLNVTPTTVTTYIKNGKLKTIKTPGGHKRIPITIAEEFIRKYYNIKQQEINTIEKEIVKDKKDNTKPTVLKKKTVTPQTKNPISSIDTKKIVKKDQKKK